MNIASVSAWAQERIKTRTISVPRTIGILVVIALLSLGIRLATFQRYLPYIDYGDETNMYLLGRDWRGAENVPVVPVWLAGYPPLYVWVNQVVQQTVDAHWRAPWIFPSNYWYYTRLLSVVFGFLTTLVLMRLGWRLGGWLAAALAGILWGLTPAIVDYNSLAIPDPLVYLCCSLALMAALEAWYTQSRLWLTLSIVAGVAAVYAKYPAVFAVIPWAIVGFLLFLREPRRWWHWLLLHLTFSAGAALYLFFGYGALQLDNREAGTVRSDGLHQILDIAHELNNWYYAILPIGLPLFFGIIALGGIAYVVSRRRKWPTISLGPLLLILIYGLVGVAITTTFTVIPGGLNGKHRHTLPITAGLIVIWSVFVVQIYGTLRDWLRSRPPIRLRWLPQSAVAVFALVVTIPLALGCVGLIQLYQLKSTTLLAQEYSNDSLPNDGLILFDQNSTTANTLYNRPYSGYSGGTAFNWWIEDPTLSTPQQLAERGMTYFVFNSDDWKRVTNPDELRQYIQQFTPLGTIKAGPGRTGYDISFYRILPPQVVTQVMFGDQIRMEGYDLSSTEVKPGQTVTLRPYWRALSQPPVNYSMFVHLYPAKEVRVITQYDGTPALSARPTISWGDPTELVIGSDATLTIPADTPPGDYVLALGLYDFATGQRLTTSAPQDDKFEIPIKVVQ